MNIANVFYDFKIYLLKYVSTASFLICCATWKDADFSAEFKLVSKGLIMTIKCVFKFERGLPIFYSGENICGHVTITTTKHMKINALNLNLLGTYKVQWNEKSLPSLDFVHGEERLNMHELNYVASQLLLNMPCLLSEECLLTPGSHDFSFNLNCSQKNPPTTKHALAEVAYKLQLNVNQNNNKSKYFSQLVVIKSTLDLNLFQIQTLRENFTLAAQQLEMFLPQTAYVPGQIIRYNLRYKSMCTSKIHEIKVCLVQKMAFNSLNVMVKNKQIRKLIACNNWRMIDAEQYIQLPLAIPASTADSHKTNWPIQISYTLEVVAVDYKNKPIDKVNWPLIIGTIAHKSTIRLRHDVMGPYCFVNFVAVENDENVIKHNLWTAAVSENDVDKGLPTTTITSNRILSCERLSLLG